MYIDMKLELNESTLNAYITEAIRQELSERTRYNVDFDKLGNPGGNDLEGMSRRVRNKFNKKYRKASKKMGEKGYHSRSKTIKKLRELGYTDEQIAQAIKSGAITPGKFENGKFKPHTGRKLKRKTKRLAKADDDINSRYQDLGGWEDPVKPEKKKRGKKGKEVEPQQAGMGGGTTPAPVPVPAPTPDRPNGGLMPPTQPETPEQPRRGLERSDQTAGTGAPQEQFPWDSMADNQVKWTPRAPAKPKQPAQPAQQPAAPQQTPRQPAQAIQPAQAPASAPTGVTTPQQGGIRRQAVQPVQATAAPANAPTGVTGPKQTIREGKLRLTESQVNAYIRRAIIEELYGPQNNTGAYPSNLVYGKPAPFSGDKMRVGKFQTWFNANFGGKLVIDGIWGPKTQGAWNMWLQKQYPGIENKTQ